MNAWPQYMVLAIIAVNLFSMLNKEVKQQDESFRIIGVVVSLLVTTFFTFILWAGGFWAPIGWPA